MSLRKYVHQVRPIQENYLTPLNKVLLSEAKTGGATYEVGIIMGWYNVVGKKYSQSDAQVSNKNQNKVKPFHIKTGENIVKNLIKIKPDIKTAAAASHSGSGSVSVTSDWAKYGAKNTTPKTDLIIGKYNISLKMGPAQIMSGAREEALATFYYALNQKKFIDNFKNSPEVQECVEIIEQFQKGYTTGTTGDAIKSKSDQVVVEVNRVHKLTMARLETLFNTDEEFKYEFYKEAMSGYGKFGKNSFASADWFLVSDASGSRVSFHSINDDKYIQKVANTSTISVKFKSNSVNPRDDGTDRRWWSALGLMSKDLTKMKDESLDEGLSSFVKNIVDKTKKAISKSIDVLKGLAKRSVAGFLKFLGILPPDVSYKIKF